MVVSALAVLVSAVMFCAQVATFSISEGFSIEHLLRFYMMAFCIMFILAELRLEKFLDLLPSFNNWVYRGFLYSFNGVIGAEMSKAMLAELYPHGPGPFQQVASLMLMIASYSMFALGGLYMVMGLCCLHGVWERIKAGYDQEMDKVIESRPIRVKH
jgi:hypothetical protein